MSNGRCFMHGGRNPGAPVGNTYTLVHGRYSAAAQAAKHEATAAARAARASVAEVVAQTEKALTEVANGETQPKRKGRPRKAP
jgi:hypothetical protein